MQQANNAMLLGIFDSEDQMAKMFDTAQRLASALGKDAAFGVESLVTGLGRQSALMLDNLGIMVKSEDAYKRYAKEIGTTVTGLTDQQKKQAFVNEAIKEANKLVESLGTEQLTAADSINIMKFAVQDAAEQIGKVLTPFVIKAAGHVKTLATEFDKMMKKMRGIKTDAEKMNEEILMSQRHISEYGKALMLANQMNTGGAFPKTQAKEYRDVLSSIGLEQEEINNLLKLSFDEQILKLQAGANAGNQVLEDLRKKAKEASDSIVADPPIKPEVVEQQIEFGNAISNALSTAFDPDRGAGEAVKGFIVQVMTSMQGVIIASGAMSKALKAAFTPQGFGVALLALAGLEVAKVAVSNIKFAQKGFDGIVTQPTLFVTGEAGPERVQVTPSGQTPSSSTTINIHGGVINDDYIRNELIPALNKATGLGSSINA